MHLKELLPKPFRNIISCYDNLKDPAITRNEREKNIQDIVKDVFRMLLVLPLVAFIDVDLGLPQVVVSILISPPATMLSASACCAIVIPYLLVDAVAKRSFPHFGLSVALGFVGFYASETYDRYIPSFENYLIAPLSNQVARAFI